MKGNDKIAFTAEAIALMRARENSDPFSQYFVSAQIQRKFDVLKWIFPRAYLNKIFHKRTCLSRDLDKLVHSYNPEQIIELACGYSPRGLIMTQKDPNQVYIETDFLALIERKKTIIDEIEGFKVSQNHHLVSIDAIDGDLYETLRNIIDVNKRTLIITETLTSYLNPSEYEFLIDNIEKLLDQTDAGAYLSHESKNMLPGIFGWMLLFYRDRIAKTRNYKHFENQEAIKTYFLKRGFKQVGIVDSEESSNILYLATKK